MLVVIPGTVAPARLLVDVLREAHEDRRAAYQLRNDWQKKHGIPSTPDIDWAEERKRAAAMVLAVEGEDVDVVRLGHQAGLMAMAPAPVDPGPWVPIEGLETVTISPIHLSAAKSRALRVAWQEALHAGDAAAIALAQAQLVMEGIYVVGGLQIMHALDDVLDYFEDLCLDDIDMFAQAGLLPWLLSATLYLQGLPSGKAYRSGALLPRT